MQLQYPQLPEQLTRADSKLLDYIANHTDEFLFSSIGQLARRLELSEATVSRFVRHVGCRDYKELKQVVMRQSALDGPAARLAGTIGGEEFTAGAWLRRQQAYLQKTLENLDENAVQSAVQALAEARRVFIHARSASSSLAQLLFFRLRRLIWLRSMMATPKTIMMMARMLASPVYLEFMDTYFVARVVRFR